MLSLGMLTINALVSADSVIVLVQVHYLPVKRYDTAHENNTCEDNRAVIVCKKRTGGNESENY